MFGFLLLLIMQTGPDTNRAYDSLHTISLGDYRATIDARASARVISFQYQGKEVLTGKDVHPFNYGSTLWPSPQSEWHWPPPAQLDGEAYSFIQEGEKSVFTSKKDTLTGLQFRKKYHFDDSDSSFMLEYSVKNLNDTARYTALWEVTRAVGGLSFFPKAKESAGIKSFSPLKSVTTIDDIIWYEFSPDSVDRAQKIYENSSEGWLAHVTKRMIFVKKFDDIPKSKLPPGQGNVEIYVHKDGSYIELENHGKYALLQPGELMFYTVKWYVCLLPGKFEVRSGNQQLTNLVRKVIGRSK